MITVVANGRPVDLPDGSTLAGLLDALGVPARAVAAMEHNGEPVPRAAQGSRPLADGDRIELVRAVAGG
jgi:sulfur carrier protein